MTQITTGLDIALARRRYKVKQPELATFLHTYPMLLSMVENGHVNPTDEWLEGCREFFAQKEREARG